MISLCEKDLQDGQAGHQGQHPAVPTGVYFKEPPKANSTWFLFPTVFGCEYTPVFSTCHCTACRGCYSKCRCSSISCHAVICCLAHDHRTRAQAGHLGQSSLWLVLLFCLRLKSPFFQALWDWVILFLVIYTAIFTPYVAAFLLNEPGYSDKGSEPYGSDPIVIIDLLGGSLLPNVTALIAISSYCSWHHVHYWYPHKLRHHLRERPRRSCEPAFKDCRPLLQVGFRRWRYWTKA